MKALILIWSLLLPYLAFGQASNADLQYRNDGETLINGSFEQGKKGYTFTVGSGSPVWSTQATTSLTGKAMQLTLSAQTFSFKSATTQGVKFQNQSGVVEAYISASASGAEICPLLDGVSESVGSNQCMPIIHNVGFKPYVMQRVFGATSLNYEIRNVSGAFTGDIFIDDGSIAKKSLVANLSGAQFYGSVEFAENCDWSQTSTTSYQSYTNDSVCSVTVLGDILAPSINIPAFRFKANSKLGKYLIIASVPTYSQVTSGTPRSYFQPFYDGVAIGSEAMLLNQATATSLSTLSTFSNVLTINAPLPSEKVFEIRHKTNGGSNARVNTDATSKTRFDVYFYPDQPISTINTSNGWFIDANIGGANPSVGTVAVTTYTGIENASLDMVLKSGSTTAKIPCSATNSATGLTCSVGNESVGVVFTPPKTGKYKACFEFSHYSSLNANSQVATAFQIIETTTNTQTIIQEGGGRLSHQTVTGGTDNNDNYKPFTTCGIFTFNDTSEKTLRLMFEQAVSGTVAQSVLLGDRSATLGQRDIHITVEPVVENIQASLQGYNSTSGMINPKIFSATISTSGVVVRENGDFINGNCSLSGNFTCNFVSGIWTSTPVCSVSPEAGYVTNGSYSLSTTSIVWSSTISGIGNNLSAVDIFCHGY